MGFFRFVDFFFATGVFGELVGIANTRRCRFAYRAGWVTVIWRPMSPVPSQPESLGGAVLFFPQME
jgi:hypothetical protein